MRLATSCWASPSAADWRMPGTLAGVLHDLGARDARHSLHWQLPQACHRHRGFSHLLPEPHVPPEHAW